MIIFGRKILDKDYGPVYPVRCPNCDNSTYFHALKWRFWAHIFWIPLIPWTANRELVCPICSVGTEVSKPAFKQVKKLVEPTQQYRSGNLTKREYAREMQAFEREVSWVDNPISVSNPDAYGELPEPDNVGLDADSNDGGFDLK